MKFASTVSCSLMTPSMLRCWLHTPPRVFTWARAERAFLIVNLPPVPQATEDISKTLTQVKAVLYGDRGTSVQSRLHRWLAMPLADAHLPHAPPLRE